MSTHPFQAEAEEIRRRDPTVLPVPLGIQASFGFGDRIGVATAGHVRALRRFRPRHIIPIFAQQSIREMTRTARTPQEVMDAAIVAVHRHGWKEPWGADADHLKTEDALRSTMQAGFTMFTIDPSDHVDNEGATLPPEQLEQRFATLFPGAEERAEFLDRYAGRKFSLASGESLLISEEEAKRTAVIYLRAIEHMVRLAKLASDLWKRSEPFDLEISVDETETPTTPAAHYIIASELLRQNVSITAIAPRFVGKFEKAVDYRGSIEELDKHIRIHADIASTLGPYKLSLHSGSDKLSVYPLLVRHVGSLVHVKTAGTSYLEALRIVARHDADLFRGIAVESIRLFEKARATYHLSTVIERVPDPSNVSSTNLEALYLDTPEADDARQVLHVAYGEILTHAEFGVRVCEVLDAHSDEHADCLAAHFERHLRCLA